MPSSATAAVTPGLPLPLYYRVFQLESKRAMPQGGGGEDSRALCLPTAFSGIPGSQPHLLLGDLKHAEALVLLQKFVLGPDLLSEAVQLLLLLLGTQVDARHGADDLPHLLELGFEGVQVLVDVWAVLVHTAGGRGQRAVISIHGSDCGPAWLPSSVPHRTPPPPASSFRTPSFLCPLTSCVPPEDRDRLPRSQPAQT